MGIDLPSELSGGEQQRVGIVRAMIGQPKILLMDEPFSALDAISRKQLQVLTKELHKEFGMTTIFVTHDTDEALNWRTVLLSCRMEKFAGWRILRPF